MDNINTKLLSRANISKSAPLWLQRLSAALGIIVGAKTLLISGLPIASPEVKELAGLWFDYIMGTNMLLVSILVIFMGNTTFPNATDDIKDAATKAATLIAIFFFAVAWNGCKTFKHHKKSTYEPKFSNEFALGEFALDPDTSKGVPGKVDIPKIADEIDTTKAKAASDTSTEHFGDSTVVTITNKELWYIRLRYYIRQPQYFYITYPDVLKRDTVLQRQNDSLRNVIISGSSSGSSGFGWLGLAGGIMVAIGAWLKKKK